jgi:hypothetical protein
VTGRANSDSSVKDGVVVIAGDLFEKEEDLGDDKIWQDAGSEVTFIFISVKGCFLLNTVICL